MKVKRNQMVIGVVSILILLAAICVLLCDIFVPLNLWTHPILNFLFCIFVGFGTLSIVLAFGKRSSWYFFIGGILLALSLLYVLCQYIKFWIALIIVAVLLVIMCVVSFLNGSNKTENIALNERDDYKNYEQRKAEKEAAEKNEQQSQIPEIKSFK